MHKQGKSLSLTSSVNQAKKSVSYYSEYRSCSQTIQLANGLGVLKQNSLMIHMQLGSSSGKIWDKFPNEFHHLEKENLTELLASTHFLLYKVHALPMQTELSPLITSDYGSFMCRPTTTSDLSRRHSINTKQITFQMCSNYLLCPISSG